MTRRITGLLVLLTVAAAVWRTWQTVRVDLHGWQVEMVAGLAGQAVAIVGILGLLVMLAWGSLMTRRNIKRQTGRSAHDLPASNPKD